MDPKTIEQKSNLSRPFLSAKKLIFIVLALVIVIGLVVFSLTTILDQFSFSSLLGEIHSAFTDITTKNTAIFMAILLVTYFFFKFFNVSIPYMIRLKALGIKVPLKEAILYYLTSAFLTAISPGILLTEPYNMFWLKTQGVTTAQATAIVWINEFIYHTLIVFITLPAFIYLSTQFSAILTFNNKSGMLVIILASIGMAIDLMMFAFYWFSGFSKKFHYLLSRVFNRVKQFFHLQYHTKGETHQKYLIEGVLYKSAKHYLKQWKNNSYIALVYLITTLLWFSTMYASLVVVHFEGNTLFSFVNFIKVMGAVSVVTTANRYLPIPGGEGMMQLQMRILLSYENGNSVGIDNAIFMWRAATNYFPAIIGLGGFITYLVFFVHARKKKKPIFKEK